MELEDYKVSEAAKVLENANLIKKYHANLVYDYTEYPTKSNWKETFTGKDYKTNSFIYEFLACNLMIYL